MRTLPRHKTVAAEADRHEPAGAKGVRIFCACGYLFFLGSLTHLFGGDEGADDGPLKALYLPIALFIQLIAIGLLVAPKRVRTTTDLLRKNQTLVAALALILASAAWSIDPEATLRHALALVGTTALGLLIFIEFGPKDVLRFFAVNLLLFVAGSVIIALAVPELGTHVHDKFAGDWRGLLTFKNQAAWAAVTFLLVWLGARKNGWMRSWNYPLVALGFLMLFKTESATGRAAIFFGIAVLMVIALYRRSRMLRPLIVIYTGSTVFLLAINYQTLYARALESLGRDDSLTGRTSIWSALWPLVERRLWFGYGYQAFWDRAADYLGGPSAWMIDIGHAHNAYIEILLDVGIIGLVTQVAFLLVTCWKLSSKVVRGDSDATAMLVVFLTLATIGIAGALFFRANTGIWIMIVAFACYASDNSAEPIDPKRLPDHP